MHIGRLFTLGALIFPCFAFAGAGITYHGKILAPDGQPLTSSAVQFRVQIRTPGSENCLMYQETQVLNMSASDGIFAVTINDGTATVVNTEPFSLDRVFQNRGTFTFAGGKCVVGNTYVPNVADGRKISVEFFDNGSWEPLPAQTINFVPMSMESLTVGGFNANNLVRVVDGTGAPASNSPLTQTQYDALKDLADGTSTNYLATSSTLNGANLSVGSVADAKISGVSGAKVSGDISGNSAGFTGSLAGDVTGTQAATVVTKIQGRAVDTAVPSNGQVLAWNNSNSRWEPTTPSSSGGTVTAVTASGPLASSGGTTPAITIAKADTSTNGYLSSTDWTTFNGKQNALGFTPVNKAGDTMSGALAVPTNGFMIGTSQLVASGGSIGIGTTTPNALLDVNGTMRVSQICDSSGGNCKTVSGGWGAGGSVTSVDVSVPPILSVSGGPITSSGTIAVSLATQSAKTVFAGPVSGGAAAPTFRALNIGDIQSTNTGSFLSGGACTTGQALVYNSPADTISCASISLTSSQVTTALSYTPVDKAGDTMTGALNLASNGLAVGTSQLVVSGGSVGIGTTNPNFKLDVRSAVQIKAAPSSYGADLSFASNGVSTYDTRYGIRLSPDAGSLGRLEFIRFNTATNLEFDRTTYNNDGTWTFPKMAGFPSIYIGQPSTEPNGIVVNSASTGPALLIQNNGTTTGYFYPNGSYVGMNGATQTVSVHPNGTTYFNGGNVGVGTTSPTAKLETVGQIVSRENTISSGATVDFSTGNVQTLSAPGTSTITVSNMVNGGQYTVVILDTTSRTYTFSGCATSYFSPGNGPTSQRSVYSILKTSAACMVTWQTGFQ